MLRAASLVLRTVSKLSGQVMIGCSTRLLSPAISCDQWRPPLTYIHSMPAGLPGRGTGLPPVGRGMSENLNYSVGTGVMMFLCPLSLKYSIFIVYN